MELGGIANTQEKVRFNLGIMSWFKQQTLEMQCLYSQVRLALWPRQACLAVLDLLPLLFVVWLLDNKILTVNVLGAHHEHISKAFSSKLTPEERFKHGEWIELETGAPVLEDALVSFDCEIEQIQQVGTHTIFICPIVAIKQSQHDQSLVYFNRAYHQVGQTETV